MSGAALILALVRVWLWVGAAVAALFLTIGIGRIDEDARGAWIFRPLLVPGILLIWPMVLWRWWVLETGRDNWAKRHDPPRYAHRWAAALMAAGIALAVVFGLTARQEWPAQISPVQLSQGAGE